MTLEEKRIYSCISDSRKLLNLGFNQGGTVVNKQILINQISIMEFLQQINSKLEKEEKV